MGRQEGPLFHLGAVITAVEGKGIDGNVKAFDRICAVAAWEWIEIFGGRVVPYGRSWEVH